MRNSSNNEYLLGVNQQELERLRFQHGVWSGITNQFFDRLNVQEGWKCLDVGSGPGSVSIDLRERVGASGEVVALEPSRLYVDAFNRTVNERDWKNVSCIQSTAEEADLPSDYFNLVFARWVISFSPDPEKFLFPLFRSLKPAGLFAIQDYYYEGLSLFPNDGPFNRMHDIVIAHYRSGGGDPYVAGKLPGLLRKHGFALVEFSPHCLAGGPGSPIMEWGYRFFSIHTQYMVDRGLMSQEEGDAMVADWEEHLKNPDALFFSPLVVDIIGRKES